MSRLNPQSSLKSTRITLQEERRVMIGHPENRHRDRYGWGRRHTLSHWLWKHSWCTFTSSLVTSVSYSLIVTFAADVANCHAVNDSRSPCSHDLFGQLPLKLLTLRDILPILSSEFSLFFFLQLSDDWEFFAVVYLGQIMALALKRNKS